MFNLFFWKKNKSGLTIVYLMAFFLSLAGALPAYVQSSFLETYIGITAVNWFFIAANLISLFTIIFFPKIIKKFGNYLSAGAISLLLLISLASLSFTINPIFIFIFFILMQISINLIWINMDIFIKELTKKSSTGQTRGIYFTIINLAWIFSPSLSALVVNLSGYTGVFLISAFILFPFILIFSLKGKNIYSQQSYKTSILKSFKSMFKDKDLTSVFWLATMLNIFFSVAVITIPIYLNNILGFSWSEIGLAFSIMLIPFLIVEIPAGFIADKYLGEKEMFAIGFAIIVICLSVFSISTSNDIWFWTIVLFISRVGAALIESMREAYFFKKVSNKDVDKINIFRTALPLGYLLGSLFSIFVLMIWPVNYIFLVAAVIICPSFIFIFQMKDTK